MKAVTKVFLFLSLIFLIFSCNCNKDCRDCQTLDEENCDCIVDLECQCSDGIKNGNETDIDCGGDCQPCFDCLSNYCVYLSGGTSDGPVTSITWEGLNKGFTCFSKSEWEEPYADNDGNPGIAKGNWSFDDPSNPSEINVLYYEKPYWWPNSRWNIELVSLKEDSLVIRYNGQDVLLTPGE